MPFETLKENKSSNALKDALEQANMHLEETINNFKIAYGKSWVDQKLLIPDQYADLVWFLFPSEVLPELLKISKKGFQMSELPVFVAEFHQNDDFSTPFIPKDYNKYTFDYQIETDYLEDSALDSATTTDGEQSDTQTPFNLRKNTKNTPSEIKQEEQEKPINITEEK